ncbi:sigma-70 family RNA polymerase sigma factor [Alcaligenes faecalis]|uniref:sigma-70 family RNA polymerase sigma factor n=1 Tax=Alcaligenes faecalis TaxID=511 RepID=UPI000E17DF17|nr:sigma-70 family RNA polymerase sigma factor [Alcaligenes faecalis]SSY76519.1 Probable RNA polymerase sigma factor fecI [Alcaligenes faecalis subsp. faecalis]
MPRSSAPKKTWLAHYSELVAAWRRKAPHEDSEDAMQDAALRLLENAAATVDNPRAYLKRSTANGVIDRYRRQAILPTTPLHELDEHEHPQAPELESELVSRQMLADLKSALNELPLVCQQVYVRHRIEGWTHAEIASAMGISRSVVEKHMSRTLRHLNKKLQKYAS